MNNPSTLVQGITVGMEMYTLLNFFRLPQVGPAFFPRASLKP